METNLPIIGENDLNIELDSRILCQEVIANQISQAKNNIAIFSQNLEFSLYNHSDLCRSIELLVSKNRKAQVRIICKDSNDAIRRSHCLINLAQNHSSFVEIRKPSNKEINQFQQSWLLVDDVAYCKVKNIERFSGLACYNDRLKVKEALETFNHAWENSEIDQQTRRLSL